ncbi:MAG: ABC transporter permease subunit [Myxococcota bacterium]
MRNTLAIAGKEARIYLTTWTSYILFGAFLLISAFFFQRLVIEFQFRSMQYMQMQQPGVLEQMNLTDWVMGPLFLNITVFFLFMLPILTMRLLAEERRTKTLELLMTSPVRAWEIVLGKYLGALAMMAIMLALTTVFPLLLAIYGGSSGTTGALDWHTVATSYLGMLLLGASFVSVGLFASSVTDSQIVAVIVGFAALLMFYVIGLAARGEEGFWQAFFEHLSITGHLDGFVRGIIKVGDVVYYLSLVFVGLFLSHRVVDALRYR